MERDEHIYAYVMDELQEGVKNEALWIKAYALVDGASNKIKPRYIQYRVEEIKGNFKDYNIEYNDLSKSEIDKFVKTDFRYSNLVNDRLKEWSELYRINAKAYRDDLFRLTSEYESDKYEFDEYDISKVKILDREGLEINYIPKEIGCLFALTEINFSENCFDGRYPEGTIYNYIKHLPESIGKLLNLTTINLSGNLLTVLPSTIGNLSSLRELILYDNRLIELPKEIVNLRKLKEIKLFANQNLILTQEQKEWLLLLRDKGCKVMVDEYLFDR